ncbi:MAG: MFS transporter [Fimbriimonadaceae bacterium]|nr:MFS transporter [Fimbriimonadaceae bacterium]
MYFFGQGLSLIGNWVTRLATGWLVYELTGSPLMLGVVSFSGQIVTFVLGPVAAAWMERFERRRFLVWTQAASMVQSLTLAYVTLTHVVTYHQVIALTVFQGVVNAFDMPGRQSFLVQMVDDREDLGNAIAINSSMVNAARLVGPAIAGLTISLVGTGMCFFIDGVSYLAVIVSLLMMDLPAHRPPAAGVQLMHQLREGWQYISTFRPMRVILLNLAATSFLGISYSVLLPIIAGDVMHGGASTLAWLTGASGVGALVSALSLVLRKSVVGLTHILNVAAGLLGVGMVVLGLSHAMWLSMLALVFTGFGFIQVASATNTIIQTLAPEDMRTRVMGYFTMAFFGSAPVGSLLAGAAAHQFGTMPTLVGAGLGCLATTVVFTLALPKVRADMRPVYQELGLIPAPEPDATQ